MPSNREHIVVVEDEPVTRAKLANYLTTAGYRVSETATADDTRALLARDPASLLFIDINLPGEDGLELTREQRSQSDAGIILVTGRTDEVDRIVGLEMGADEYVTKPFNARELLARAKNLLRRVHRGERPHTGVWKFADWTFDSARRQIAAPDGTELRLTRSEHELLAALVRNAGEVLTRDRLMMQVLRREWGPGDRTIDVLVRRLRQKLEHDPHDPHLIQTAHGEGYVFVAPVEQA